MPASKYEPSRRSEPQMIRYHKGDEKKFSFPVNKHWKYQLALKVIMENRRTGKQKTFGKDIGLGARSDYAFSMSHNRFDFKMMYVEAIDHAYDRIGGSESEYDPEIKKEWKVLRVTKIYVVLHRYYLPESKTGKLKSRPLYEFKPKTKAVTKKEQKRIEKELEKKFPSPKRYVNARKALHKKNLAMAKHAEKRKK